MTPLSVRVEYVPGESDPRKILQCCVDSINALTSLDDSLAQCISSKVTTRIKLDGFKEGSWITKMNKIFFIDDDILNIDPNISAERAEIFVNQSRETILKAVNESGTRLDGSELLSIIEKVNDIAKVLNVSDAIGFTSPNPIEVARAINEVSDCSLELMEGENIQISSKDNPDIQCDYIELPRNKKVDIDDVVDKLKIREIENTNDMILVIKKPDFLGDSQWEFKKGKETITAKIEDEKWLNRFKNGLVVIIPNDALHVDLYEKAIFDKNGMMLSVKRSIIQVKEKITGESNGKK